MKLARYFKGKTFSILMSDKGLDRLHNKGQYQVCKLFAKLISVVSYFAALSNSLFCDKLLDFAGRPCEEVSLRKACARERDSEQIMTTCLAF